MSKNFSSANLSALEVLNINLAKSVKLAEIVSDLIQVEALEVDNSLLGLLYDTVEYLKYNVSEYTRFEECIRCESDYIASTANCPTFVYSLVRDCP